jgi:hypothetical protein
MPPIWSLCPAQPEIRTMHSNSNAPAKARCCVDCSRSTGPTQINLAAESDVSRSIERPRRLHPDQHLPCSRQSCSIGAACLPRSARVSASLHISTDEIFGSLGEEGFFTETTAYRPNSPRSASEASSESFRAHLARDLRAANPRRQLLEQLRSLSLSGKADPARDHEGACGRAAARLCERNNIRDWLYVEELANVLTLVLARRGQRYPQCQRTQGARQSACGGERLRPSWTGCRRVWPVHSGG